MSIEADYFDTYYGLFYGDDGDIVALHTVKATCFDDAHNRLGNHDNMEVKRWKPPRLVESPADIARRKWKEKKAKKGKTHAPQFNRSKGNRHA